jgi:hypothetical protein
MQLWRGLNIRIFELTRSQSLVLDGHEVDYYLVLVFYGRISGLRS